jgi:hypothetical protein
MLRAMQEGLPDAEARQILSEEQLAIALNRLLRVPPNHYKEGRDVQGVLQASDAALRAEVERLRRRRRPMADDKLPAAIREAEESLRRHDTAHWSERGSEDNVYPCITALRALLAALSGDDASAPPPAPSAEATPDGHGCPIEGEPGHEGCAACGHPFPSAPPPSVAAAAEDRVEAKHRCCLDLLRSARLYFADGHPMRLAIERTLAERPGLSSARAAKGGE